ncbi:MAG TPA: peroxiredoxin [Bdellovibrionota bacterium]|nr:peroxiredoxin [Bdellovibrionota bacterium]
MQKLGYRILSWLFLGVFASPAFASDPGVGDAAPVFQLKTHENQDFDLAKRKGQWTVLYFYPKSGTPGCTKQACAFRDNIKKVRDQGAEVYGISTDSVESQAKFHKEHALNFTILADADAKVTSAYGAKMPVVKVSKRWTFIVDPELKIRAIEKDVDPVLDAERVAKTLASLKK